jgi:hypothetical protein
MTPSQRPSVYFATRIRLQAILCSLAFVLCALASRPYVEMGLNDDWSYARTAQLLAQTGHIIYNGWSSPILGWQLFLGALFIKLFGYSFTVVRFSMLPITLATAFLLQRTFVRAGLIEWNATVATLTLVLSPLYLPLAVTYMTDVPGLLVLVLCLYACLRALQASTPRATIAWISFAAISNALGGTVRQIAWLGALVMVPSALWLVRRRPGVLLRALPALLASIVFIFAAIRWFQVQPYSAPESLHVGHIGYEQLKQLLRHMIAFVLDLPVFLLPVLLVFVPALRRHLRRDAIPVPAALFLVLSLAVAEIARWRDPLGLEPVLLNYVTPYGLVQTFPILGPRPIVLVPAVQWILTVFVFAGVFSFLAVLFTRKPIPPTPADAPAPVSWHDLGFLLVPSSLAYLFLLMPRATTFLIFDRYLLVFIMAALLATVRCYQEQVQTRLPLASLALIVFIAIFSVAGTHDVFAMYQGRLAAVNQVLAAGVPDTAIDGGFEFDAMTQIMHTGAVNEPRIRTPAGAYKPMPVHTPADYCHPMLDSYLPAIVPRYALSFNPDLCQGDAGFPPIFYRTWLPYQETPIYVVKYAAPANR